MITEKVADAHGLQMKPYSDIYELADSQPAKIVGKVDMEL
jgi:hypothetical protein